MTATQPDEDEVISYLERLSNWGRWGDDDQIGTLNLITPEKRLRAGALLTDGTVISCSRLHEIDHSEDNPNPMIHFMRSSGGEAPAVGKGGADDWVGLHVHGYITHFDTLSHYCWNRQTYNGRPASEVSSTRGGAVRFNVDVLKEGVFSRGVLLDVPRMKGVATLDPGYLVSRADLERCERKEGVTVESGDVLMIRTGRDRRESRMGRPGIGADCLPFFYEREIAVLVGDSGHDVRPQYYEKIVNPIHTVCLVAMGMQLIDSAYMEDLTAHCDATGRWSFLFVASPLRLERTTGSPCNPLALF